MHISEIVLIFCSISRTVFWRPIQDHFYSSCNLTTVEVKSDKILLKMNRINSSNSILKSWWTYSWSLTKCFYCYTHTTMHSSTCSEMHIRPECIKNEQEIRCLSILIISYLYDYSRGSFSVLLYSGGGWTHESFLMSLSWHHSSTSLLIVTNCVPFPSSAFNTRETVGYHSWEDHFLCPHVFSLRSMLFMAIYNYITFRTT